MSVFGQTFRARNWYSHKNVNGPMEDAAETALIWLNNTTAQSSQRQK